MYKRKREGITYQDSSEEVITKLLKDITIINEAINSIDISNTTGYGIFNSETGNAPYKSWKDYLHEIVNRNWEKIKKENYIDRNLIDESLSKYIRLLKYVKEERKLLHGDF